MPTVDSKEVDPEEKTPILEQYESIKSEHRDEILLFRLGDFYEVFNDDARVAARELEITLTSKPVGKDLEVPMAGVPVHSAESYIETLIENGHRVAVCEQVQDASEASGVVDREVVRVITPGTLTEEDYLDSTENNFLLSIDVNQNKVGVAYVDLSTGEFEATEFEDDDDFGVLDSEINRLYPSEILIPDEDDREQLIDDLTNYRDDLAMTRRPGWQYQFDEAQRILESQFDENVLKPLIDKEHLISAAGSLLQYLKETQKRTLSHLNEITSYEREKFMVLDGTSQRNLELVRSLTGQDSATLLNVLDETETAMGSRRLRQWILHPLLNLDQIHDRQQAIEWFSSNPGVIEEIKQQLQQVYDIQRIIGKIGSNRANPKDVKALGNSLDRVPEIREKLPDEPVFDRYDRRLNEIDELRDEIRSAIQDNPPQKLSEGEIFKDDYDEELDELREAMRNGRDWITELQKSERERTGIDSLKVGHNKVHGYYIEVTKANLDSVPDEYERKQTLTNSERYITDELKEKEQVILGAEEKSKALEEELFVDLRSRCAEFLDDLKQNARVLSDLDVLTGLSMIARERGYVQPTITDDREVHIEQGRHPVVEEIHEDEFVPNDLKLTKDRQLVVLTGPNMSGKSTYIRQVALISIMAQMGSFVPADSAEVGLIDQVFTRVGARDFLAGGQSTFMVEMVETADILNHATERSLLILDEVGRGTSTYDGLAIARAVVEYIVKRISARALFATHYHELTDLAEEFDSVINMTVRAREWDDDIVFLRQVEEGRADRSYGVHVAKLAGLPTPVLERARNILDQLETGRQIESPGNDEGIEQLDLFHPARQLMDEINQLDPADVSPREALDMLYRLKDEYADD
ncbi:MAG: DNA mismatch repair protein MutS [bacterium]